MNQANNYLFSKSGLNRPQPALTSKEIAMLRLAKRVGSSLESTAKLILLLRAQQEAVDQKAAMG